MSDQHTGINLYSRGRGRRRSRARISAVQDREPIGQTIQGRDQSVETEGQVAPEASSSIVPRSIKILLFWCCSNIVTTSFYCAPFHINNFKLNFDNN